MGAKGWLIPAALFCGFLGGAAGNWCMSQCHRSATFETVRVTKDLLVAPLETPDKGCRVSADGAVTATGGLVANQVHGNVIVGRTILASANATQQRLENQEIAVEISAGSERGGEIVIRNRDSVFCPAKGPIAKGYVTFIGFDKNNQMPAIYTHDVGQGPQGRAFVVCAKPKTAAEPDPTTASQANQAGAEQEPLR